MTTPWIASTFGKRVLTFLLLLVAAACAPRVADDRVTLAPAAFADLPGWSGDDPRAALDALTRSCARRAARPPGRAVGPFALAGFEKDWAAPCAALAGLDPAHLDARAARAFVERHFRAFALSGPDGDEGLFTGYYEAAARGARTRTQRYNVPLYRRPPDLVEADLGIFSDEFRGRTIAGRVADGRLVPYDDRRRIARGGLAGQGLELLWLDDPVDAFFLEIQGSGRVTLDDGSVVRVGFAAKNGRPYTAIGRVLADMGALPLELVSMQSIRAWLSRHPDEARAVMEKNAAYVFFRELDGEGPIGAEGVVLTPGRSLAVDRKFLPLGVPVYVAAEDPDGALAPVRALMIAQDTGGAIRGAVRGDIFVGAGDAAAERAGRMKMRGRGWVLLPRGVVPRAPAT
jgi:membrane-bound lytic murein transglycosylase A